MTYALLASRLENSGPFVFNYAAMRMEQHKQPLCVEAAGAIRDLETKLAAANAALSRFRRGVAA